ncbi:MAG: glycoside hydrolase family 25 protein, partial [Lachnospiraceae bacterium]|nr:glycoside hydrolase family 25 protein [Lachnospiraceae bacterium]
MAMPNLSFMQAAMNAGQVYAAELETESEIITEEVKEVETKETEVTQVSETETTNAEETENEEIKMTQVSETETTDDAATEGMTETEETPKSEIETTPETVSETEITTETIDETETAAEVQETELDNEEADYINTLLEKLKKKYSNMYINDDGYFEYTDENGVVHTYDPYDPELYKNLLENDDASDDNGSSEINQFNADNSGSTVSPFTKKTYIHEDHVSNKIVRNGIDVSKYQGEIDWEKAKKAGVYFAFIRVGYRGYSDEGKIAGDEYAKDNIKKAHDAGVKVGIYFFSQAITEPEASEEAEFCIKFLRDNNLENYISLPVMIDYEYTAGDTKGRLEKANLSKRKHQDICDRFVRDVRDKGYDGGIYASYTMLRNDMQPTSSSIYSKTQYWIARYNEATKYSDDYKFWQYSSSGKVDGISGRVDCNFAYEDKRKITSCRISIDTETDYIDDIKEALCIYDTGKKYELVEGKDYEVTVTSETVDGKVTYKLVMTGIGEYEGRVERTVTMTQLKLSEAMISDIAPQEYTGFEITQETGLKLKINNGNVTLTEGQDYTVSYADNISAGTGYVVVTGMGNYTGEVRKGFEITGMKLTEEMFEEIPDVVYTGYALETDSGVIINGKNKNIDYQLVEGIDYTLKYSANKNAGEAKVTVVGKGNYAGELPLTFRILSRDFSETAVVSIGGSYDTYVAAHTGKPLKPSVTVMVNGDKLSTSDYTIEYGNNTDIGTEAYVLVKGKRNYTGEVKKYFTIEPKAAKQTKLSTKMVSLKNTYMYTEGGEPVQPELYVVSGTKLLEKDVDYTVLYQDKRGAQLTEISAAGDYKVIVSGIGEYTGKVTKKLTLISENAKELDDRLTEVTLVSEIESLVYTGKAVTPQVKVIDKVNETELIMGTDYKVSYVDNKAAGAARIVIKGKGQYKGEVTKTFDILPKNLGNMEQAAQGQPIINDNTTVSLNKYTYIYNGKKQQPKITIKNEKTTLKENRDFKVLYSAENNAGNAAVRANVDRYTMTVAFMGNYEGTAIIHYEITPADLSKVKVTIKNQLYTGSSIFPELENMQIKLGSAKLDAKAMEGVALDDWYNNTEVGKAGFRMTATEEAKNFVSSTSKDVTFKIAKKPIKDKELEITVGGFVVSSDNKCGLELVYNDGIEYNQTNGAQVVVTDAGTGVILEENKDYTVKFSNNKNAGNAKVKVSGIGGYSGSRNITFKIFGKPLNDSCRIELSKNSYVFHNAEHKPAVKLYYGDILLKSGKDYA